LTNRKTRIKVKQQSEVLSGFRMSAFVRYLTHPQVLIDPLKDVRRWSLNSVGSARVSALAARLGVLSQTHRVISSDETKALETAEPLALALGVKLEVRAQMHENDRSATGFLPPEEFEKVADKFFAEPSRSVCGWEKAKAAQGRILAEVDACLESPQDGDVLFVGHGGVGTLLFCALAGLDIDRRFDQGPGGGGCWFEFSLVGRKPLQGWQPMEALIIGS
jgi:broad specificity phosphatase PhoE